MLIIYSKPVILAKLELFICTYDYSPPPPPPNISGTCLGVVSGVWGYFYMLHGWCMVGSWVPGVKIPPAVDVKMLSQLMKELKVPQLWELIIEN